LDQPSALGLAPVGCRPLLDQVPALVDMLTVVLPEPADDVLWAGRVWVLSFAVDHSRLARPVVFRYLDERRSNRGVERGHLGERRFSLHAARTLAEVVVLFQVGLGDRVGILVLG